MSTAAPSPLPSEDESRAQACFDALMWALSRPGEQRRLPEAGFAAVIAALLDRECAAYADDPALAARITATGAALAAPAEADRLFLGSFQPAALQEVRQGSDLHPEEGATVILAASHGAGPRLRLTGPGIEGVREIRLDLPPETWRIRQGAMRYPMGFELFVIDGAQVIGLPRSTRIEVL